MSNIKLPITKYGIGEDIRGNTWLVGEVNGKQVGVLVLDRPNALGMRRVIQVWTDKEYRRIGVAEHLWKLAKVNKLNPIHDLERTPDGLAWSEAVGR